MGQGTGSKTDTAVKLVLIFFISLLSFSVGTFVGKQVSDADHRRASLEIHEPGVDRGVASTQEVEPETAAISDEEVASLTREFLEAERATASEDAATEEHSHEADHDATHGATTAEADPHAGYDHIAGDAKKAATVEAKEKAPAPAAKKVSVADEVKKAADRVAETLAPTKDAPKVRQPTATLPVAVAASSVGKYTVQIGSYATEDEAREYATKMKEKGYSAFYVPADVKGRTWYRVSVGLYGDAKGAEDYRQSLLKDNVVKAAIVQKIVK